MIEYRIPRNIIKSSRKRSLHMLKKNDILTLTVTDLTNEGMGVAKHEGYVLFM